MPASLAFAYLNDAGRAAARRWLPLVLGIGVVASILFARHGMTARDAVLALEQSWPLRAGLFSAWVLAAAPAVRQLFGTGPTLWLRSLAPARALVPAVGAALLVAELPWSVLFVRGAGVVAGAGALLAAAAAHSLLAGRRAPIAGLIALAVALLPGHWLALAASLGLCAGAPAAWRAGAEARQGGVPLVGGGPLQALASAHLLGALRSAPAALARAVIVVVAGGALAALVGENNQLEGRGLVILALAMGAPFLVVALGGIAGALATAEADAGWLLSSMGVSRDRRALARWAAAAAAGGAGGAAYGVTVSARSVAPPLLAAAAALLGAVVAVLLTGRGR